MSSEKYKLKQQLDTTTKLLEASQVMLEIKNSPANAGDMRDVCQIPESERSLDESMATHSSILAWRISWTEEPLSGYSPQGCKEAYMTEVTQYACTNTHPTIRVAKIQNAEDTKCYRRYGTTGILIHSWWKYNMVQLFWKIFWQYLTKLNLLYDTGISSYTPCYLVKQLKSQVHIKPVHRVFIAALFIIAKAWKK